MKTYIQITRHLYEEPYHINLVILASNGLAVGGLEFYLNPTSILELGNSLTQFPKYNRDSYLFQRGSERVDDFIGWYFRFRATALVSNTDVALQLCLNNNQRFPRFGKNDEKPAKFFGTNIDLSPRRTDFHIISNADRVKQLGQLLIEFSKLQHQRLYWDHTESIIDNDMKFKDRRAGDNIEAALLSLPH